MPASKLRQMTKEMHSSLKLLITLTFLVISLPNQHMEFSHPKSFVMLGSVVRKMICSKGLRASPKKTTETLHHQWPQVITEEMSEETSLDHDQTGTKTSPEPHRTSQKNYYQHSKNFWNFLVHSYWESQNVSTYVSSSGVVVGAQARLAG